MSKLSRSELCRHQVCECGSKTNFFTMLAQLYHSPLISEYLYCSILEYNSHENLIISTHLQYYLLPFSNAHVFFPLDYMTADWYHMPYEILHKASTRIINEVSERVLCVKDVREGVRDNQ